MSKWQQAKFMAKNYKDLFTISQMTSQITEHIEKRCNYCDKSLGTGDDTPVEEFIIHLITEHREKVDVKKMNGFLKKIGSSHEFKTED